MKYKLTTLAVSCAIVVSGCGGGNNNTAPANTATTYKITNKTNDDFKTITVLNGDTGVEYQTGSLDCASQSTDCTYYYTGPEINGPDTLVFKDASGKTVAGYVSGFHTSANEFPVVSNWSTGLYLYQKLNRTNPTIASMSQSEIESRIQTLFLNYNSPDGLVDNYEEIALYYSYERSVNKIDEAAFLTRLSERLINQEVADASEFRNAQVGNNSFASIKLALNNLFSGKTELIRPAYASSGDQGLSCPSAFSIFLNITNSVAGAVSNAFPVAGGIGVVVSTIGAEACGSVEPSTKDLMDKLNKIETSLNQLHDSLGKLSDLVSDSKINDVLISFNSVTKDATTAARSYNTLTLNKISLNQYLKNNNRTLEEEIKKFPNGNVATLMDDVYKKNGLVDLIDKLNNENFNSLAVNLKAKCANPGEGDIVNKRVQCNIAIATTMSRLVAAQEIAYKIAQDVIEVAYDPANQSYVKGAYPLFKPEETDLETETKRAIAIANERKVVKDKFEAELAKAASEFNAVIVNSGSGEKGYFNAFDGLPDSLIKQATMGPINCWDNRAKNVPIAAWIKESNGSIEYIETYCRVNDANGPVAKARYFLKLNGNAVGNGDVGNVMGVLVDKRYMDGESYISYTYAHATPDFLLAFKASGARPEPGWFSINNTTLKYGDLIKTVDPRAEWNDSRYLQRVTDKNLGSPYDGSASLWAIPYYGKNENGKAKEKYNANWIRNTDAAGYSTVFILASGGVSNRYIYFYCITGDCKSSSQYSTQISFEKSTQGLSYGVTFPDAKFTLPAGQYNAGQLAPANVFFDSKKWLIN